MIEQRNISLVKLLKLFKRKVCYDHLLSKAEIEGFGVNALDILDVEIDCVIVAVAHDEFKKMKFKDFLFARYLEFGRCQKYL